MELILRTSPFHKCSTQILWIKLSCNSISRWPEYWCKWDPLQVALNNPPKSNLSQSQTNRTKFIKNFWVKYKMKKKPKVKCSRRTIYSRHFGIWPYVWVPLLPTWAAGLLPRVYILCYNNISTMQAALADFFHWVRKQSILDDDRQTVATDISEATTSCLTFPSAPSQQNTFMLILTCSNV